MKATLIKILGKIFIKSDYNGEFISALKHIVPPKNRRWNSAFPIGFYYRLMTSIPLEKLSDEAYILNNIKTLCDSGLLKKTWEVDESYFETVRDLCLKHFLEVYLQEDENITRIIASETLPYDMVNNSQEKLTRRAQYRPGEIVRFRWDYDTVSSPDSRKDELNFQFYFLEEDRWVFATNFSRGPREEIAPNISSTTARFEVKYLDKIYMYTWEGSFYCPRNSILNQRLFLSCP
jgi:signal peptidase I